MAIVESVRNTMLSEIVRVYNEIGTVEGTAKHLHIRKYRVTLALRSAGIQTYMYHTKVQHHQTPTHPWNTEALSGS